MAEELVGRCPAMGHPINRVGGDFFYTCLCPGRADGIYMVAVGVVPKRVASIVGDGVVPDSGGVQEQITELVNMGQFKITDAAVE